jgi:hypothetical protein
VLNTARDAADLAVSERIVLFCLASGTEWERAGVTHATAQQMLVRGLIDRDPGPARFKLTPDGLDVLAVLGRDRRARASSFRASTSIDLTPGPVTV